jgi:rubredoxin
MTKARYSNEFDSYTCPDCGAEPYTYAVTADECRCAVCGWQGEYDKESPAIEDQVMKLYRINGIDQEVHVRRSVGGSTSVVDLKESWWAVFAEDGTRLTEPRASESEACADLHAWTQTCGAAD